MLYKSHISVTGFILILLILILYVCYIYILAAGNKIYFGLTGYGLLLCAIQRQLAPLTLSFMNIHARLHPL